MFLVRSKPPRKCAFIALQIDVAPDTDRYIDGQFVEDIKAIDPGLDWTIQMGPTRSIEIE